MSTTPSPNCAPILPRPRVLAIVYGSHWLELWTPDRRLVDCRAVQTVDLDRSPRLATEDLRARLSAPWRAALWGGDRCGFMEIKPKTPDDLLEREWGLAFSASIDRAGAILHGEVAP